LYGVIVSPALICAPIQVGILISNMTLPTIWGCAFCRWSKILVGILIHENSLIWISFSRLSNMTLPTMVQVSALVALCVLNPSVQFIVHTLSSNAGYWMSPIVQYTYCKMR
jgi:hypothetical protein